MLDRVRMLLIRARDSAVNAHVRVDLDEALALLFTLQDRQVHAVRSVIESSESRMLASRTDRELVISRLLDALGVQS